MPVAGPLARSLDSLHRLGERGDWDLVIAQAEELRQSPNSPAGIRLHLDLIRLKAQDLRSLWALHRALTTRWQGPPDVSITMRQVADLLRASGDVTLTTSVQRSLAFKAFREGRLSAAARMWPPGRIAWQDGGILRDLKAVLLDEGNAEDVRAKGPPRPTASPLTPEPPEAGTRPRQQEKATAGLPPFNEKRSEGGRGSGPPGGGATSGSPPFGKKPFRGGRGSGSRESAAGRLGEYIDVRTQDLHLHLDFLHPIRQDTHARDPRDRHDRVADQQEEAIAAVVKLLRRPLAPSERILVYYMRLHGKDPSEMFAILRDLERPTVNP
jgi:hypothetical protein